MQVIHRCCAGLDVHQKTISACVSVCKPDGSKTREVRVFGAFTRDLLALADWLKQRGVTHVAMGSDGGLLAAGVGGAGGAV